MLYLIRLFAGLLWATSRVLVFYVMSQDLTLRCKITDKEDGQQLLELLVKRFAYLDIGQWCQAINAGCVLLNDKTANGEQLLCTGDDLVYNRINHQEPEVATEVEIILETPELLLVGKPAGTPVSRTGIIIYNTFANILRRRYQQEIHLLHRLDRETSGLMLCARSKEFCCRHQKELQNLMTGKYYLALIRGRLDRQVVTVDQPLATKEHSDVRCRMWVAEKGKPSRTIFHEITSNNDYTLLLVELITGRKHQIRTHLDHLGRALVGDKIYSHGGRYYLKRIERELSEEDFRELGAYNQTLHAWAVQLKLPEQPAKLYFSRIFSPDMGEYLKLFPDWERKAKALLRSLTITTDGITSE